MFSNFNWCVNMRCNGIYDLNRKKIKRDLNSLVDRSPLQKRPLARHFTAASITDSPALCHGHSISSSEGFRNGTA